MNDNIGSPYFYQWDQLSHPFQKLPLPPTPTKGSKGVQINHHIRMASLELSDSYSLGSNGGESTISNDSTIAGSTSNISHLESSLSITDAEDSYNFPSEISEYYERRQSIKRVFPPLPAIPTIVNENPDTTAKLPIIDEVAMFSIVSTSNDDLESSYSNFDWRRPQYIHLKKGECKEGICWGLFIISLLAVPFSLCIYLGWLDTSMGLIPRKWKIANLISFCVISILGVVGIVTGLAIGL